MKSNLEWATGLFEGEGTIGINGRSNGKGSYSYCLRVAVDHTDKEVIDVFDALWPIVAVRSWELPSGRTAHRWYLDAQRCVPFLQDILPYLRRESMRCRVELGLDFCAQRRRGGSSHNHVYLASQIEYAEAMKGLNQWVG